MQITLLRHGEPAFKLSGVVRAKELQGITRSYDASGIVDGPPPQVVEALWSNKYIVCSDLMRSLDSAEAFAFDEIHRVDRLFREAAMPHFGSGALALPIGLWVVLLRSLWLFGFSRNGESFTHTKARARLAARRLTELAARHERVLLVGHGFINYLIARELRAGGWHGPKQPGKRYWEYGVYGFRDAAPVDC